MKQSMQVLTSSETNDWYTPRLYIDAVVKVMGGIDLDPASCEAANKWIGAKQIFTIEDDGLSKDWGGRIFLNPPYGKTGNISNQEILAGKLKLWYESGYVTEAILLTKCVPGYNWWETLFRLWPVCFVRERIEFVQLDIYGDIDRRGKAKAGSNFWYVGPAHKWDKFGFIFRDFGRVIYPTHDY